MTTKELRNLAQAYEDAMSDDDERFMIFCYECGYPISEQRMDALHDALGPDAARLLADAIDRTDDHNLHARFEALGAASE